MCAILDSLVPTPRVHLTFLAMPEPQGGPSQVARPWGKGAKTICTLTGEATLLGIPRDRGSQRAVGQERKEGPTIC